MQGSRGSLDKDQVYGQGRKARSTERVDEKETEAVHEVREYVSADLPTYGQVMKEA
jgi:hypothetical protein